jgi:hypothetical protein
LHFVVDATLAKPLELVMSRCWSLIAAAVFLLAALATMRFGAQRAWNRVADPLPLEETAGRVQLVLDEQDIGLVRQGTPLKVRFAVVNTGSERLLLRQDTAEEESSQPLPTFTVEPGQTGEVIVQLTADDLLVRGRKHIRFYTSDITCPEVWLTIRGTVVRQAAAWEDD